MEILKSLYHRQQRGLKFRSTSHHSRVESIWHRLRLPEFQSDSTAVAAHLVLLCSSFSILKKITKEFKNNRIVWTVSVLHCYEVKRAQYKLRECKSFHKLPKRGAKGLFWINWCTKCYTVPSTPPVACIFFLITGAFFRIGTVPSGRL